MAIIAMHRVRSRQRSGFTLVELLVVIAIIGILVALLLPAIQAAREAARRAQCLNNLKQIGLAIQNFESTMKYVPASREPCGIGTWAVQLLPFIEETAAYSQWDRTITYYSQRRESRTFQVAVYYCPTRRAPPQSSTLGDTVIDRSPVPENNIPGGLGDYAGVGGDGVPAWDWVDPYNPNKPNGAFVHAGPFDRGSGDPNISNCDGGGNEALARIKPGVIVKYLVRYKNITDGLSKTLFVGEKHLHQDGFGRGDYGDGSIFNSDEAFCFIRYAGPGRPLASGPMEQKGSWNYTNFGSWHPGICNFLLGDGSVRGISNSIDPTTLKYSASRADGQVVDFSGF